MRRTTMAALTAMVTLLIACGSEETGNQSPATAESAPASDASPSMQIPAGGMDAMAAHMQRMDGMSPDSMMMMMPEHRQMVANTLAQMNRDMQAMNMAGDAAWSALVDSVRADLVRLPDLAGEELKAAIAPHHARVTRLIEMHKPMMGGMKM